MIGIFATQFSVDISMSPRNVQVECIELQSDIEVKEKCIQVSLLDFYKLHLSKEKYSFYEHADYFSVRNTQNIK